MSDTGKHITNSGGRPPIPRTINELLILDKVLGSPSIPLVQVVSQSHPSNQKIETSAL